MREPTKEDIMEEIICFTNCAGHEAAAAANAIKELYEDKVTPPWITEFNKRYCNELNDELRNPCTSICPNDMRLFIGEKLRELYLDMMNPMNLAEAGKFHKKWGV